MFGAPIIETGTHVRSGTGQWIAEAVATFGLLVMLDGAKKQPIQVIAAMVGAYITGAYWFTASTSFANPAVTIARALTDSFAGIRPADAPGFIASQVVGFLGAMAWIASETKHRVD
jgi:glycerol uptake facilitator-like aquaporin